MGMKLIRGASMVFLGASLACLLTVSEAQLRFATGDDAEISDDGLHHLENDQIPGAWGKLDLDLSGYSRLYFQPAGVAFRDIAEGRANLPNARSDELYAVPEFRREQLRELFAGALHVDLGMLAGQKKVIGVLATVGVVVTTFLVAGATFFMTRALKKEYWKDVH